MGMNWVQIPGQLKWCSIAADGTTWGVRPNNTVCRYEIGVGWRDMPGSMQRVSVGSGAIVWGISPSFTIHRFDFASNTWTTVPGALADVSAAADGTVWGSDGAGGVYRFNHTTQTFVTMPGTLKQVAAGSATEVWGIAPDNTVRRLEGANWVTVPGVLAQLAVAADRTVYGVTPGNLVYRYNRGTNDWIAAEGAGVQVTCGSASRVIHVNAGNLVWSGTPRPDAPARPNLAAWAVNLPVAGTVGWTPGFKVRYAVAYELADGVLVRGPWWAPAGLQGGADANGYVGAGYACASLDQIARDPSGLAVARRIYRQFEGCPEQMVGRIGNNTDSAFVDFDTALPGTSWQALSLPGKSGQYEWRSALALPQAGRGAVVFLADGSNDVHVAISPQAATVNPMYEIVIGGWGNNQSVIRRSAQGGAVVSVPVGLTSPGTDNPLWIAIDSATGTLSVGRGAVGQNVFMTWKDPNFLATAKYVALSSWDTPITYTEIRCLALPANVLLLPANPTSSIQLGNPAKLDILGKITMSAWIRPDAVDGVRDIVARGFVAEPAGAVFLRMFYGNYQCGLWASNGAGDNMPSVPIPAGDVGQWVHLAGVYDGQAWILYRNGREVARSTTPFGAPPVAAGWAIGSRAGIVERCVRGHIRDVTIWNIALDAAAIARLVVEPPLGQETGLRGYWPLDEGTGASVRDCSPNPVAGALTSAVWTVARTPAPGVRGLVFASTGTFAQIGDPAKLKITGPITITAWIRPLASDGIRNIVAHGYSYDPPGEVYLRIINGHYQIGSWDGGGDHVTDAAMPAGDLGKWVHLAGVYDGQRWILYRNGVALAQTANPVGAVPANAPWAIGAQGRGTDRFFSGTIHGVSIWNVGLDAAAVERVMTNGLTGGEAGLVGYWPLGESGGAVLADLARTPATAQVKNAAWETSIRPADSNDYTNWMSGLPGYASLTFRKICVPYTHDSLAYALTDTLSPTLYDGLEVLAHLYPNLDVAYFLNLFGANIPSYAGEIIRASVPHVPIVNTVIRDAIRGWGASTSLTVGQQLRAGARFLDLHVCSKGGELRGYHTFTGPRLAAALTEIAAFLAQAQAEVVIIKAAAMASLSAADHKAFTELIEQKLGDYLFPYEPTNVARNMVSETPFGTITTRNGVTTSRVIFVYSDDTAYSAYQAAKDLAKKQLLLWPDSACKVDSADTHIASIADIGTAQSAWLSAYTSAAEHLCRLDFAYTPRTEDLLPSILMSVLDALQWSVLAGTKQSLRTAAIAANRRILGLLQQTSVTDRRKVNLICLDFIEYSYAAYLAIKMSWANDPAIDSPPWLAPLPPSDFDIGKKYSRSFGAVNTPHVDIAAAHTLIIPAISSAIIPHADSSGAHTDADLLLFHIDNRPHWDTPSSGHIDTPAVYLDSPHADVAHQDVQLHIDVN